MKKYPFKYRFTYPYIDGCQRTEGWFPNVPRKGDIIRDNLVKGLCIYVKINSGLLHNVLYGKARGKVFYITDDLLKDSTLFQAVVNHPYYIICDLEMKYHYITEKEMVIDML